MHCALEQKLQEAAIDLFAAAIEDASVTPKDFSWTVAVFWVLPQMVFVGRMPLSK